MVLLIVFALHLKALHWEAALLYPEVFFPELPYARHGQQHTAHPDQMLPDKYQPGQQHLAEHAKGSAKKLIMQKNFAKYSP